MARTALHLLAGTPTTLPPTLSYAVIEPTERVSHQRLQRLVGLSLPQLLRFRSRLVERPFGVGPPSWTEIDSYDPSPQIHRATLRGPDREREFADLIARLASGSRDRREMRWEAWSIDGLSGGRWALAVCLSAELSGYDVDAPSIWSRLLSSDPHHDGTDTQPQQSSQTTPAISEVVAEVIGELIELQFKGLYLAVAAVTGLLRGAHPVPESDDVPPAQPSMRGPIPRNAFSAPLTERRAVACASIWRADLETVSTAFGGDVTTVMLAACTMSLRAWLQRHGAVPEDPLAMWMPLARPGAAPDGDRDSTAGGQIRIPVQLADPIEILTKLHTATERMTTAQLRDEREHVTVGAAAISSLVPSAVLRAGTRLIRQLDPRQRLNPITHGRVAVDTGQSLPDYCAGGKVVALHTVTPLPDGCGLTITPTTQGDQVHLSVCVCPDNVPAVDEIANGIVDALEALVHAARKSPRGEGLSVVTEMATHTRNRRHARGY